MQRQAVVLLAGISLGMVLVAAGKVAAEPDDSSPPRVEHDAFTPRWENISGPPRWLDGTSLRTRLPGAVRGARLKPGESVTIRVEAGQQVRAYRPDGRLEREDLEFRWSNGTGLSVVAAAARQGADGASLIAEAPVWGDAVVTVVRPAEAAGAMGVALFVPQTPSHRTAARYREPLVPVRSGPGIRVDDAKGTADFWSLDRTTPLAVDVTGPMRIAVRSLLRFDEQDAPLAQSYRIYSYLDDRLWHTQDAATMLDTSFVRKVDGCRKLFGRPVTGYLNVPAGTHRLELHARRPVYVRLLASVGPDDFLVTQNVAPTRDTPDTHDPASGSARGFWGHTDAELRALQADIANPSSAAYLAAVRVAEDNGRRHGGLAGAMALSGWPRAFPGEHDYQILASRRYQLHTYYRDLVPDTLGADGTLVYARFLTPTPGDGGDDPGWLPDAYAERFTDWLDGGYFFSVGGARRKARTFLLPERGAPSVLRISVDRGSIESAGPLFLQYDQHTPRRLWIDGAAPASDGAFRPSAVAAALATGEQRLGLGGLTLAGAAGPAREPAPMVSVAYLEMPLPQGVRQVRLWRQGRDNLRAALAFRDSRPFRLPETGFVALAEQVGPQKTYGLFLKALSRSPNGSLELPDALRAEADRAPTEMRDAYVDLYNQWLPLLRVLHSRKQQFESGVAVANGDETAGEPLNSQQSAELERQAKAAEREAQWLQALERRSHLWHAGSGAVRVRARKGQIDALERLGEFFLAEQLARYDFLHGETEVQRQAAFERLLAWKRREGDLDGQLGLLSAAVIRQADTAKMVLLAEVLLESGRSRLALLTLLALPAAKRPARLVVEAAYLERWWGLFEQARRALSDTSEQHLWAGYRAQRLGDFTAAREHWQRTGASGEQLVAHLDEGLSIREDLGSSQPARRASGLKRWEVWQAAAPGRRVWKSIPQAVSVLEETELLYVPDQALHLRVARTGPDNPVEVTAYGPGVLRFRVRPVHVNPALRVEPINDWVLLREDGNQRVFPVIDNQPVPGLRLLGRGTTQPGRAVDVIYEVPAGFHTVQLRTELAPAVVEVEVQRPLQPLTVLPALNPYSARAALEGVLRPVGSTSDALSAWSSLSHWLSGCGENGLELTRASDPALSTRGWPAAEPPSRQWFKDATGDRRPAGSGRVLWGYAPALAPVGAAADTAVLERLSALLWAATHDAAKYPAKLAEAENLYRANPAVPGAQRMLRRLRRSAKWEQVTSLQGGAGVRLVEVDGWHPENPELRLRKALMPPLRSGEQILAGHDVLTFAVDQPAASEFIIRLRMEDLAHQVPHRMTVKVARDDEPWRHVELTPAEPFKGFLQEVGAGAHALRLWIEEPLVGQYLRVRILERHEEMVAPVVETRQRTYHLATPGEPLIVYVEGPALLRVHEWRDGDQVVRYEPVKPGWQEIPIEGPPGQTEGLYRVYRQAIVPQRRVAAARLPDRQTAEVPAPHWESLPPGVAREYPSEALAWTRPQDGTWSFVAGVASRRVVDDEPNELDAAEQFAQARVTYRRFAEDQETYYRWGGLIREREQGHPTLGLDGRVSINKQEWPVDIDLAGSFFLQRVGENDRLESATTLRVRVSDRRHWGPKIYHRPFLSVFKRWLTLDGLPRRRPEEVDQDVFTGYKHDHRQGLKLGDIAVFRPWMDSLLYTGVALASNDDFNPLDPDHTRLRLGAKQLFGDLSLGVDYSWYHYFKDDDRDGSHDTQRLRVDLESAGWWSPVDGWMGNLRYEYDQESGDSSVWVSLGWNRSNGRYFRDFRPGETDFVTLRQERALERGSGSQ